MLKWMGGRRATGAALKVSRACDVVAALPSGNAVAAVNAITEALEAIKNANALALNERFDEIQQLDIAAVVHTRTLLREYLNTSRQKKLRESELWNSAHGCWSELASAYADCVQRYAVGTNGALTFRLKVPVALARALRALRRQLQWTRIRYSVPSVQLWSDLAGLYTFLPASAVAEPLLIYPGENTSIKLEFLKVLMQSALSCEILQPPGQDLATQVVGHFASLFVLSKKPDTGCTHWFDFSNPQAPVRNNRTPLPDADVCYFGAGPAVEALKQALAHLEATRELPPALILEDKVDPAFVKSIFASVHEDWSGKTQSRQHERQKINARITVVPGFKDIVRTLEFVISDSLDFTDQPTAESWVVDDVSESGYGAVIPAVAGDWVEVGSLVGFEGELPQHWRVGMVRRVLRLDGNQQRVGVQLLGRKAALVRIRREDQLHTDMGISQKIPLDFAILLNADIANQSEVEVMVRGGSFTSLDKVYMEVGKQQIVLRPKAVVEKNAACERVAFTVVNPGPWVEPS
jgi:hypothetical protein